MKNIEIVTLANLGVLEISNHALETAHAYKVFKFKKALRDAAQRIAEADKELVKECGVDDPQAFDAELVRLRKIEKPSDSDRAALAAKEKTLQTLAKMRDELNGDECTLDGVKALPYGEWKKLQDENKEHEVNGRKVDLLTGYVEMALEGVLWTAPNDEDDE